MDSQFIYWADFQNNSIGRADLAGNFANNNFIPGASSPQGVAVDAGHIYWSNTHTIGRANLDGSSIDETFIGSADSPLGVAVDFPPASTTVPSITGATVAGQTLSAVDAAWTLFPTSFSHQWLRCDAAGGGCTAIGGANGQTYGLTAADVGSTIRVQEVAANPFRRKRQSGAVVTDGRRAACTAGSSHREPHRYLELGADRHGDAGVQRRGGPAVHPGASSAPRTSANEERRSLR